MDMRKPIFAALLVAGSSVQAAEFQPEVFYDAPDADVTDGSCADVDGLCTLRAAIQQANALPDLDEIVLPAGEYRIRGYYPPISVSPTSPGPSMSLGGEPLSASLIIIDPTPSPSSNLRISAPVTIQGAGAGRTIILMGDGEFSVSMASDVETFTLTGVTLDARDSGPNCAVRHDRGIADLARVEVAGSSVCNHASMRITGSTVRDNRRGSAVSNYLGQLQITDSALINNRNLASSYDTYGGALSNKGVATVSNTTISGNTADYGAAVFSGGPGTRLDLNHVTVTDNVGRKGAVVHAENGSAVTVGASILGNGDSQNCAVMESATVSSDGHNIDSANSCGFSAVGDQVMTDPHLSVLAHFGGGTLSHGPLDGSPAIDAISSDCPESDQRGTARPLDGNGDGIASCDIGAHERVHEDQAPVADAGGPYVVLRDAPLRLDGSASYDANPESPVLDYFWDFGDGTAGTGKLPTHTYEDIGLHTVTLNVTDGNLQSAPATTTVTVNNNPPIAEAGFYQRVEGNSIVRLDGTGSSDPDGVITSYAWRYVGGGKNQLVIHDADTATPWFRAPKGKFSHGYLLEFELTVTDNDGDSDRDHVKIYVPPKPFHYH